MQQFGITGGIGSGKTTVCNIFEILGIPVYYADVEAKKLMKFDLRVKSSIIDLLGQEAYDVDGELNTKYIGKKIFNHKILLQSMNHIVHPAVHEHAEKWKLEKEAKIHPPYVLREAALLVENGSYKSLDGLIVVTCPVETRIERVMKRDNLSREEVIKRIQNQMPEEDKVEVADFVIINDGEQPLIHQILNVHQQLITSSIYHD